MSVSDQREVDRHTGHLYLGGNTDGNGNGQGRAWEESERLMGWGGGPVIAC